MAEACGSPPTCQQRLDDFIVSCDCCAAGRWIILPNLLDNLRYQGAASSALFISVCFCVSVISPRLWSSTSNSVCSFGYIIAAGLMCAERKVLSNHYPKNKRLRHSYYLKFFFIVAEVILAIVSGAAMYEHAWRVR